MATLTYTKSKMQNWADSFETTSQKMTARKDGIVIEAYHNTPDEFRPNPQVNHFCVRHENEHDDLMTDHFVGTTLRNVTAALKFANKQISD